MADYISKNEALNLIMHNDKVCHYADERYENVVYATACRISDVVANMPAADVQPVNRWISCKDKMPEDNKSVLFVYVSENGIRSVHYGYHQTIKGLGSSWAKSSGGWQYCDDDVTYWQPSPEPPKDGDTE